MENVVNDTQGQVVADQQNEAQASLESGYGEVATPQDSEGSGKVQTPEENSKFAELRRKHESEMKSLREQTEKEARDKVIAELYGDKGVKSYDDYKKYSESQRIEARAKELADEGYPDEVAKNMAQFEIEKEQVNQAKKAQETEAETKARVQREQDEFLAYYAEDQSKAYAGEKLDQEVWNMVEQGMPLKFAYIQNEYNKTKQTNKVKEQNAKNQETTTGGVTGEDSAPHRDLTPEDIEKMSDKEVAKRWKEVKKVMGMR